MKLLIVESPAKATTIGKYVGDAYTVKASIGHVRDLPKSNKKAIDIEGGFIPHYEIARGKEKVLNELAPLTKKASEIFLATDPDREGEAIAWHLREALALPKKKTHRITFHEITKEAVLEALKHPRAINEDLRRAQEARRVLDRLVGYDLSGLIWKKVRYGLSAGRVQSPALRILMEREREIRAFIPEDFWVITAHTTTPQGAPLSLTCTEEPRDRRIVEHILAKGIKGAWYVADVKETEQRRAPRPPFTTSTLQQVASTRLGFSPARTMGIAQKLYEAGHITYMRTDSPAVSPAALSALKNTVEVVFGASFVVTRQFRASGKNAQEAHEAIRPTNPSKRVAGLTDEQKKLYALIWTRAVASQMIDARVAKTRITATIKSSSIPEFAANGSRVITPGWLVADPAARGEDIELPAVTPGAPLTLVSIADDAKTTQPPHRYSEAGLVKELEKRGIGRPSTYASIINTLIDRGYVTKEGRTLIPTDTGDVVSSFLEQYFAEYISDSFTAHMEDQLDDIADGKRGYRETLASFYKPFLKEIKSKEKVAKLTDLGAAPETCRCPLCGAGMTIKLGRGGKFMSCERFPDCNGARTIDGTAIAPDRPIGNDPSTGLPVFVLNGTYGPYVQLGEKSKGFKPRRASIPAGVPLDSVTLEDALKYLSLPRVLGKHPETGEHITAGIGRFGPFIVHQKDFRSLKEDDVYTIDLPRALAIFSEEKKTRRGRRPRHALSSSKKSE